MEIALIFDNGTCTTKIGLSNQDNPSKVISTSFKSNHQIINPIKRSTIVDFDGLISLWNQSYDILGLNESIHEYPVLLTESPSQSKFNNNKIHEIFFEFFNIPSLSTALSGELSLYSSGNTTGTVLECGEGSSHILSMYNGLVLRNSIRKLDLAGFDITNEYIRFIEYNSTNQSLKSINEVAKQIKELHSYIAFDYNSILQQSLQTDIMSINYELPDHTTIALNEIRFNSTEILFQPHLIGKEYDGIHKSIYNNIYTCDIDLRRSLFKNVIVSGGTTLLSGFIERLNKDIKQLTPQSIDVNVSGTVDRMYGAWIGGSIIATHSAFSTRWVNKSAYEEYGSNIFMNN